MTEDTSAEQLVPHPQPEVQQKPSLIEVIKEVQQEIGALTVDWTSPSHRAIVEREQ